MPDAAIALLYGAVFAIAAAVVLRPHKNGRRAALAPVLDLIRWH
jgi:hypothetical protein